MKFNPNEVLPDRSGMGLSKATKAAPTGTGGSPGISPDLRAWRCRCGQVPTARQHASNQGALFATHARRTMATTRRWPPCVCGALWGTEEPLLRLRHQTVMIALVRWHRNPGVRALSLSFQRPDDQADVRIINQRTANQKIPS